MHELRGRSVVFMMLLLASFAPSAGAQPEPPSWMVAPAHSGAELDPTIIRDGAGGAFVAFKTPPRFFPGGWARYDMFVARLMPDAQPDANWNTVQIEGFLTEDGVPAVVATTAPGSVWLASDWYIPNIGNGEWLARSVGSAGVTVPDLSQAGSSSHRYNSLLALSSGRVLVASRAGTYLDVSFLETDGSLTENAGHLAMPGPWPSVANARGPLALADVSGGAWVLSEFDIGSIRGLDLALVRVAADGSAPHTPAFRVVCSANLDQTEACIAPDGAEGVFVAWTDRRDLGKAGDIFASRVLANGQIAPGWPVQGKPISSMAGDQFLPSIADDDAGGIWLAWVDASSGENDIRFTRVLANGDLAPGFPTGGVLLCAAGGSQSNPLIAADGAGGFYALWRDARDGEIDLFGQHIHSTGVVMPGWTEDGLPISTDGTVQQDVGLVVLDPHHALACWVDKRLGYEKIFAALLPGDLPVADVTSPRLPAISLRAVQTPARGTIEMLVSSAEDGTVQVVLHDLSGRTVAERSLEGPLSSARVGFETSALEPGLYFARARSAQASASTRVSFVR